MRDDSVELSLSDIALCKSNLLKFYKRNMDTLPEYRRKVNLETYTQVIFQLMIETVLIESLFSTKITIKIKMFKVE